MSQLFCAYLRQADGGWTRTTELGEILDHEGAIAEVPTMKDEQRVVAEIRATSTDPLDADPNGNLFVCEYRTVRSLTNKLTATDFDHGQKILVKDRSEFVQIRLGGPKLITDLRAWRDIVGVRTQQGYILCERKPALAKLLHDKRDAKRDKRRNKKRQSSHVTADLLKFATWELEKRSRVCPAIRRWTLAQFLLAMLANDHVNGEKSTNEIVSELAGYWLLHTEKNELFHDPVYCEQTRGQAPGPAGKLVTKRFSFRKAREPEES